MADAAGAPVLTSSRWRCARPTTDQLRSPDARRTDGLFTLDWTSLPLAVDAAEPAGAAVGDSHWALLGADCPHLAGPV